MFKVSVMYPNQEGAKFDMAYYRHTHCQRFTTIPQSQNPRAVPRYSVYHFIVLPLTRGLHPCAELLY